MEQVGSIVAIIFWVALLVGVGYTVVAFILGEFGGAHHVSDGHVGDFSHDYGVSGHGHGQAAGMDPGDGTMVFGPFSPLVIAFFLTVFGATGLLYQRIFDGVAVLNATMMAIPLAIATGFMLAWGFIRLFNRLLGGLQSSSEVKRHTLVGLDAEVTVAIPAAGIGEIAYVAMGSRTTSPARSEEGAAIPRYSNVRITRIVGNTLFVNPVLEDELGQYSGARPGTSARTDE